MGEDRDCILIDGSDVQEALGRTVRTIIMIADGAIGRLTSLGWQRKSVNLEIDPESPLPCWVKLRKKRVFEVSADHREDGTISIQGRWLDGHPAAPGVLDRFMGW